MSIPPDRPTAQYPPPDRVPPSAPQHTPPNSTPWWRRTWIIATAAFVVGAGIAGAAASGRSAKTVAGPSMQTTMTATVHIKATATVQTRITTTAAPVTYRPQPATAFDGGQYLVGSELVPGTYHTDGGGSCYVARLRNLSGDPSAIIESKTFGAAATFKVEPTDYALLSSGGCIWAIAGESIPGAH